MSLQTIEEIAALLVAVVSLIGSLILSIRFLVNHYLAELKPNGGSSIKDSVNRLEQRVDELYRLLVEKNKE